MSPYRSTQFAVGVAVSRAVLESGFPGTETAQHSSLLRSIPSAPLPLQLLQCWHLIRNPAGGAKIGYLHRLYS